MDLSKPIYLSITQSDSGQEHMAQLDDPYIRELMNKSINSNDNNGIFSFSELGISPTTYVSIKWSSNNKSAKVHLSSLKLDEASIDTRPTRNIYLTELKKVLNNDKQFICFLSGAGGTGKTKVINSVKLYCKLFCDAIGVEFHRRTIVVTALTGAAAVGINGEIVHSACKLRSKSKKCQVKPRLGEHYYDYC